MNDTSGLVGRTLAGYEVLDVLGAGGMGVVYKARHTRLQRLVALKLLPPEHLADANRRQRFLREARAASGLDHPGIVTIYDILTHDGADVLVMELVEGEPLDRQIPPEGLPWRDAARLALELAEAMATAHAAGIVHRDLKPANVMVMPGGLESSEAGGRDGGGRIKVLDFGIAKLLPTSKTEAGITEDTSTMLTEAGVQPGTPAYMAPEQLLGEPLEPRADVFSFGVLAYEMLTGRRPFDGPTPAALADAILHASPRPIDTLHPGVPGALTTLVSDTLAKAPDLRPGGMDEIAGRLRNLLADDESTSRDAGRALHGAAAAVDLTTAEDVVLGWRPAPGAPLPQRPNWVMERQLGRGGFGDVWLASHAKTHERRVYKFCYAAERLRSLRREITVFRLLKEELAERHDIARLLDWNLEEPPYFIESVYTEGGSLVDWSKAQGGIAEVDLGERLELIAQVATALAAAHSVGVLHKDVKPGNVLIASGAEGRPRAVLTDFGIGQITERERLAARGITVAGLTEDLDEGSPTGTPLAGTPLYMAPELLAGRSSTLQSDIYALGVMLYQVVVGDLERPLAPGWERDVDDELLREDIASFADGRPRHRSRSATEVAEKLRALEARRTAREAERQARHAAGRAQRRRRLLGMMGAISTAVLLIVSVFAVQAMRARDDAERRQEQAEEMIDFMLGDLHEGLEKIGRLDLLEQAARGSRSYFDSLTERDESVAAAHKRGIALLNIGDVLLEQGDAETARTSVRAAVLLFEDLTARHPSLAELRAGLSRSRLAQGEVMRHRGETEAALEVYRAAMEDAEALLALDPGDLTRRFAVAEGRYRIAEVEHQMGHLDKALGRARDAMVRITELTGKEQQLTGREQGQDAAPAEGVVPWRHWRLQLDVHLLLGSLYKDQNTLGAALDEYGAARLLAERRQAADPANTTWSRKLPGLYSQLGFLSYRQGDLDAALEGFEAAGAAYRDLIQVDPTRAGLRDALAEVLRWIGKIRARRGERQVARQNYGEALVLLETLTAEDSTRLDWLPGLAVLHQTIAADHLENGETEAALASYREAHRYRHRVFEETGDPGPQHALAWNHLVLGDAYARHQDPDQARREWLRTLELIEPIDTGSDIYFREAHAQALIKLGRLEEARPLVEELLARGWNGPRFLRTVETSQLAELLR